MKTALLILTAFLCTSVVWGLKPDPEQKLVPVVYVTTVVEAAPLPAPRPRKKRISPITTPAPKPLCVLPKIFCKE